jgi:hypothetical protein
LAFFPIFSLRIGETGLIDFQVAKNLLIGSYFGGGSYLINS